MHPRERDESKQKTCLYLQDGNWRDPRKQNTWGSKLRCICLGIRDHWYTWSSAIIIPQASWKDVAKWNNLSLERKTAFGLQSFQPKGLIDIRCSVPSSVKWSGLSWFRIRMLRVRNNSCEVHPDFQNAFSECFGTYSSSLEDTEYFGRGNKLTYTSDTASAILFYPIWLEFLRCSIQQFRT